MTYISTKNIFRICKLTLDCENCILFVCDFNFDEVQISPLRKEKHHLFRKTYISGNPYTIILMSEKDTPDEYLPKTRE